MKLTINDLAVLAEEAEHCDPYDSPLFPPSVYYRFFKLLAGKMKPALSVVSGVCGGGDCLHLAMGHPSGRVVGIDIKWDHPEQINYIKENFPNFTFRLGDSLLEAKKIHQEYGDIGFLFIDSIHTYERTIEEFNTFKPFLSKGAVVMLDDVFDPGVLKAWEEMPEPKIRLDRLHIGGKVINGGMGAIIME
ncbi:MAG: class I SAM-dependent methyltransferase [Planctomycetota bacterium]|jgi:predicted O-methyltransferase YrrM